MMKLLIFKDDLICAFLEVLINKMWNVLISDVLGTAESQHRKEIFNKHQKNVSHWKISV